MDRRDHAGVMWGFRMPDQILPADLPGLLDTAPADISVLSLDCFDTLLWRSGHAPRDVFADLPLTGGATARRMAAEAGCRRRSADHKDMGEVTLDEIYTRLMPHADEAARAAAISRELDAEARHCFGFAPTVELIRRACARGMTVIVVSDTYLTEGQLRTLIARAAGQDVAAMIDRIFCSCAHGMSKAGGLFVPVLAAMDLPPSAFLHVGDNRIADYEAPQRLGIPAVHLRQFDATTEARLRMEANASATIDPATGVTRPALQLHRAQIALRRDEDPAHVLGHDVLGPVFDGFARWLQDEAAALQAEHGKPVKCLFLMRDGYLPMHVYQAIGGTDAAAVSISRFTARRASFDSDAAIDQYLRTEIHERWAVHADQLLLTATEGEAAARDPAGFRAAIRTPETMARIRARSTAFAERLTRHITRNAQVAPGDTLMLVDLGYNGSVQNAVDRVLRRWTGGHVAGRYLLLRENDVTALDKRGFIDTRHYDDRALLLLTRSVSVLEQLSTEIAGSVIDYREDGQPMRKKHVAGGTHDTLRTAAQAGALAFARESGCGFHRTPALDDSDGRRMTAVGVLARLLLLPNADERALFAGLKHDVNLGTSDSNVLIDTDATQHELRCGGAGVAISTDRLFPTAELQATDPALTLAFLNMVRHGLDVRAPDLQAAGIEVPVILADAQEQTSVMLTAWPTHGGFYRLTVPIGLSRFTAGIMLGKVAPHAELAQVAIQPVEDLDRPWTDAAKNQIGATPILEGLRSLGGALFECAPDSMIVIPPPVARSGAQAVTLVFRPIGEVAAAAVRLAA
jgi:FMN phosphatase YigB (HAD superfamily)